MTSLRLILLAAACSTLASAAAAQVGVPADEVLRQAQPADDDPGPAEPDLRRDGDGSDNPFDPFAQDEPPPDDFQSVIPGERVVLRGLNKVTAATRDFTVEFGEPYSFGSLTVIARYCSKRPPEFIPETFVFMEIYDRSFDSIAPEGGEYGERIFNGWMLGSSPALHGLEHPVYDVWPVGCEIEGAPVTEPDAAE